MDTPEDPASMGRAAFTTQIRGMVFAALTGRSGDVSGDTTANVADMLAATYGQGRPGTVNTRAAAAGLGVSQRTVQRWLAAEGRQRSTPSPGHLREIAGQARRNATTQRGRRNAVAQAQQSRGQRGARLRVNGVQGPEQPRYQRTRAVVFDLPPEAVNEMLTAYGDGGDRAFVRWLENYASDTYVDGWKIAGINEINLDDIR